MKDNAAPVIDGNTIVDDFDASDTGILLSVSTGNPVQVTNNVICSSGGDVAISLDPSFVPAPGQISGNITTCAPSPKPTSTPTATVTSTRTRTTTQTPTQTRLQPSPTATPIKSAISTPTTTQTNTPSSTSNVTNTPTLTPTRSITPSITPSATPSMTPTATPSVIPSATPSTTPTATPTPSVTPSTTQSMAPTATPTLIPGACAFNVDGIGTARADVTTDIVYLARVLLGLNAVPAAFRNLDASIPSDATIRANVMAVGGRLDVDADGTVDVATDVVYIARRLLGLPAVPTSFRVLDAGIASDASLATRIDALCP